MKVYNLIFFFGCFSLALGSCPSPFTPLGDQCIYIEEKVQETFDGAREYCKSLGGDGGESDLYTASSCDEFTLLSRYMEENDQLANPKSMYYVGAHRKGLNWDWLTLEPIPLGPPFWAYNEGAMEGMDCGSVNSNTNYQLSCNMCSAKRNFICAMPNPAIEKENKVPATKRVTCPDHGVQIGDHCYSFEEKKETWDDAEKYCNENIDDPNVKNGFLFYPSSCDEYTSVARHLAIEGLSGNWWVGAVDVSGNNNWFWSDTEMLPLGVPFWAHDEPSHTDHDEVDRHCALMSSEKRGYLKDTHCDELNSFICKYTVV